MDARMDTMDFRSEAEQHIEVHKFRSGALPLTILLALVAEAFLLPHLRRANVIELPLLVTIYFSLSKRNPSSGLLLGMVIGLVQDSLGHTPIGLYGIAKTVVGFLASSIGSRIDIEHPLSRFVLTGIFFFVHNTVFVLTSRILLGRQEPYVNGALLLASLANAALGLILFPLLDRLRKPS